MGIKGDKHTSDALVSVQLLLDKLTKISEISSKKMFGGHGVFHDNRMFAMVNSKGEIFFKTNETNEDDYTDLGCAKHSKMPYYSIPEKIFEDETQLTKWAKKSIEASKKAK